MNNQLYYATGALLFAAGILQWILFVPDSNTYIVSSILFIFAGAMFFGIGKSKNRNKK